MKGAVSMVIAAARARIEDSRSPSGRTPTAGRSERTFATILPETSSGKAPFLVIPLCALLAFLMITMVVLAPGAHAAGAGWPPAGYTNWNGAIAFKWLSNGHCTGYAPHGCWRTYFVAKRGCGGGIYVTLNEFRGKVLVGDTIDSRDVVPPRTAVSLEFDSDFAGPLRGVLASVECFPS